MLLANRSSMLPALDWALEAEEMGQMTLIP